MTLYFPNYKDVLHCDVCIVACSSGVASYGFNQHLQARTGGSYQSNVKLYLEKDSEDTGLWHIKSKWSVAVAAHVIFKEKYIKDTDITYVMKATTIGENAILLGTTSV